MPLTAFDHVNIRTHQLDVMIEWYGEILGLYPGPRADFNFPGAWLYLKDQALVHLVGIDAPPAKPDNLGLEHFALRAEGLEGFLEKLNEKGVKAQVARLPGMPVVQVNIFDPDGNHIHIDFTSES